MTVQLSIPVRNARLDAIETTVGVSAILKIRTGAQPANCAAADSGTALVSISLPSDWMSNAASGVKALLGSWSSTGIAAGTAAHYRVYESTATTCGMQGSVTATGGGGDMTLDNAVIAVSQVVNVTSFNITEGNP
jgi:hypothetical protein